MTSNTFVPGYSNDVFVSYAHFDDSVADPKKEEGWVTALIRNLKQDLHTRAGGPDSVLLWSDYEHDDLDEVMPALVEKVGGAAILLAVLSPSYVKSGWCLGEAALFEATLERSGKKAPILIVEKLKVDFEQLPEVFKGRNKRIFWRDGPDKVPRTICGRMLRDLANPEFYEFAERVAGLGGSIFRRLKRLKADTTADSAPAPSGVAELPVRTAEDARDRQNAGIFVNFEPSGWGPAMARRIRKTLEGEGRTVAFPDDEVPTERARRELQDNYRSCRAVVLTLVEAGELWLAGQVAQVTKATAFRRDPLDFLLVVTEAALGGNGNGSRPRKSLEALLDDSPLDCPWQIASLEEVEAKGVEGLFQKPGADPRADS